LFIEGQYVPVEILLEMPIIDKMLRLTLNTKRNLCESQGFEL